MNILLTTDLHYDIPRSRGPAEELARRVCATNADALVLLGDNAGDDLTHQRDVLRLFSGFSGQKFLVPGNHDLWCLQGQTSLERYERLLPELAREEGFTMIDHAPAVLGDGQVGLAGAIGWYDYSLRSEELGVPLPFYEKKISPGAAAYYGQHVDLLEEHVDDLTRRHLSIGVRWRDGLRVDLGMSDEAFLDRQVETLRRQLDDLTGRCERVVVCLHHLPLAELVPEGRPDSLTFAFAYLGSGRIGTLLAEYDNISHVCCGHSHWKMHIRRGDTRYISIGSTYKHKELEVLEW